MKKSYKLENLGCAHCAAKMEEKLNKLPSVNNISISFMTQRLNVDADNADAILPEIEKVISRVERKCRIVK